MSVRRRKYYFLLPLLLWFPNAIAQHFIELNPFSDQSGFVIQKLISGRNLPRQHRGVLLFCDRVVQHQSTHQLSGYGHVLLVQGDSITVKSDSLVYDSDRRQATLRGHVMFQDRRTILTTNELVYSLALGVAQYANQARIVDNRTVVTSQQGTYDAQLKQFTFRHNVRLVNGQTNLLVDSLRYTTTNHLPDHLSPGPVSPVGNTRLAGTQQNSSLNPDKQRMAQRPTLPKPVNPATAGDTLVSKSLIASVNRKVVTNSELSVPKQLTKPAGTSLLVALARQAVDSVTTQPVVYRSPFQPVVATRSSVAKKSQKSTVARAGTNKSFVKTTGPQTATAIPPAVDVSQESDLERELNNKRRFN